MARRTTYPPLDQYLTTIIYSIIFRAQFALQSSETNKMMAEQVIDSVGPEACEWLAEWLQKAWKE